MQAWLDQLHYVFIEKGFYSLMLDGLKNTILITLAALAIGVVIGSLIAVVKFFAEETEVLKPLAKICDIYVTVIRGVPVVVLLLVFYYVIMKSAEGIAVAMLCFGVNSGAYMAELIRSGLKAVDEGQNEAGRSLGMSRLQTMRHIIFPQAVRYILPAIGNEMVALLKETSVAGYVAVVDLTRAGNLARNNTFDAVNTLFVVALIYLIMVVGLSKLVSSFENKLSKASSR